jgi:hypothetical protein
MIATTVLEPKVVYSKRGNRTSRQGDIVEGAVRVTTVDSWDVDPKSAAIARRSFRAVICRTASASPRLMQQAAREPHGLTTLHNEYIYLPSFAWQRIIVQPCTDGEGKEG